MCLSRVAEGNDKDHTAIPACVKTCPAQAMDFGDRDKMLAKAHKRVEWLKSRGYKDANVYGEHDLGGLGIIPILKYAPEKYDLPAKPKVATELVVWKDIFNPLGLLMMAGAFGMTAVHRLTCPTFDQLTLALNSTQTFIHCKILFRYLDSAFNHFNQCRIDTF